MIMRKRLIIFSIMLLTLYLLISYISAAAISLSPSTLTISAYPGEVHYRNISINTEGNYTVYLTSTSTANISINYSSYSPLIVEGSKEIAVAFIFPTDIVPGIYDITLTGNTDVYVETPATIHEIEYRSGGGGLVYRNKTVYQNVSVRYPADILKIDELEKLVANLSAIPNQTKEIQKVSALLQWIVWAGLAMIILGLLGWIIKLKIMKGGNEEKNNGITNTNTDPGPIDTFLQEKDADDTDDSNNDDRVD